MIRPISDPDRGLWRLYFGIFAVFVRAIRVLLAALTKRVERTM
jgi:hypothetical protein